ncbi:hypothetical protein AB6A40_003280 [Gnathostoma spinigerum]|uniref:Uncharacterized protein n=1 Tax=Gnathostoma spinigerum TaxID=75299 RepID=A0ABD6EGS0_9BILA
MCDCRERFCTLHKTSRDVIYLRNERNIFKGRNVFESWGYVPFGTWSGGVGTVLMLPVVGGDSVVHSPMGRSFVTSLQAVGSRWKVLGSASRKAVFSRESYKASVVWCRRRPIWSRNVQSSSSDAGVECMRFRDGL